MRDTNSRSSGSPDDTDETYRSKPAAADGGLPAAAGRPTATARRRPTAVRRVAAFASGAPFLAVVAAVETAIAGVALGVPGPAAPVAVGLAAFAVYAVDHVADAAADVDSTPARARLAMRYGDQLTTAAALSYGLAAALAVRAGPTALALLAVPGVAWIGYASDWLPSAGRALDPFDRVSVPRLKDVFLLNSVAVALAWATAVSVAPLAFAGVAVDPTDPTLAVVFGYVAARSFVDVEVPNLRDAAADARNGVATLPVVVGVDGTRLALLAVDAAAAALLAAGWTTGALSPAVAAALGVGLAVAVAVTALADRLAGAALGVAPDASYLAAGATLVLLTA
jgi:4-hydroxybenzoate polyprenyltransferase